MASWVPYALLSALFAAPTAIFAKIGVIGVDSDLATAIRTVVILLLAWDIAIARGATAGLPALTERTRVFLVLLGVATGPGLRGCAAPGAETGAGEQGGAR